MGQRLAQRVAWLPRVGMLAWLLALAHCSEPLVAPSAYTSEQFLCDSENAAELEARVEGCRQAHLRDQSCAGVVSFRGVVDAQPMVFDAEVTSTIYRDMPNEQSGRTVTIYAKSPYFRVRLNLGQFAIPPGRTMSGLVPDTNCEPSPGTSCSRTELLNLEARGGTYFSQLLSQTREIQRESPDELRVAVRAGLIRGGSLEGCFAVFPPPPP